MKLKWIAILGVVLLAAQVHAGDEPALKNQTDKQSYSNGVAIARDLKQQGGQVNLDILIQGMNDELKGEKLLMTEDDLRKTMAELQDEIARRQAQAAMKRGETKAKADGRTATAANAGPDDKSSVRKDEGQAKKPGQGGTGITAHKAGTSVAERYEARRAIKNRAAEMRRRTIEQERRATARPQGAI